MELTFILVSPARGENVGAVARAMKTMGFERLRIVASQAHLSDEAGWVAHGSQELLRQAQGFDTLAQAVADQDLVIASTARRRGDKRVLHTPAQAAAQVAVLGAAAPRTALVFGCEESGLSNADLALADLLTTIPLANPYPSLNLAQAAMLYAYEFSKVAEAPRPEPAGEGQLTALKQRSISLMNDLNLADNDPVRLWLKDRIGLLNQRDVSMAHTLVGDIEKALKK
ncbi:tRNA/rRNA methyltransferase [Ferrimonas sediminicola]|uniref:tRNA (cytidine/uridine-2'-O-)-methyltransferase TrmJ n=1 Tax=Ferrimonas sediminicola TaxID=2569538 RepID=A0A4U1BEQ1_9GAMM|nr:tRNA/rRNA methyltransferase [Ferrimonas sediminicola]TKB49338.1 tRNA/rRNA methyltransferase [Ferrimonas sediminicola]